VIIVRIAICEDEAEEAAKLEECVKSHNKPVSFRTYNSAEQLLSDYEKGERFDLILMDIQMPGLNGFDAAKRIKKAHPGKTPLIAFVTTHSGYAPDGYGTAWRYALKPIERERVIELIDLALGELEQIILPFETAAGTIGLDVKSIMCFEVYGGKVTIKTTQGTYTTKSTLAAIAAMLPPRAFVQVHRSYYVNVEHVKRHKGKEVFLSNDESVPLGIRMKAGFVAAMADYLRDGSDYDY